MDAFSEDYVMLKISFYISRDKQGNIMYVTIDVTCCYLFCSWIRLMNEIKRCSESYLPSVNKNDFVLGILDCVTIRILE